MATLIDSAPPAQSRRLRRWLLAGAACLVAYGSLYPFAGWRMPADFPYLFSGTLREGVSRTDLLANLLLYMPLGFLPALGRGKRSILPIVVAALAFSLGMESIQAFLPGRIASWLDILMNTCGAGVGAVIAVAMRWPHIAWTRPLAERLRHDRVAWLGIAALAGWVFAELIPFVPSLSISNLKAGLKPIWWLLRGSEPLDLWRCGVYIAATAALTVAGASALRVLRWGGVAAAILLVILPMKVLVVGRQLSPEALIGTGVGVALGLALWAGRRHRALVIAAWLVPAYVIAEALHPGAPHTVTHAFNWIPMQAYIGHPINGLANMADDAWPPLLLACLCLRLGARFLWGLLPLVVLLLLALQVAQLWIPGRYADITTVLVGAAAWIVAVAYAGRQPADREVDVGVRR